MDKKFMAVNLIIAHYDNMNQDIVNIYYMYYHIIIDWQDRHTFDIGCDTWILDGNVYRLDGIDNLLPIHL